MPTRPKAKRKSPSRIKAQRTIAAKLDAERRALDQLAEQIAARRSTPRVESKK